MPLTFPTHSDGDVIYAAHMNDVQDAILALYEGTDPIDSLVFSNPSVTSGTGVLINHSSQFSVNSSGLSLIQFNTVNTGSNQLYTIDLTVDTNTIDTGAGLSITNVGKSDNIYLKVSGKTGASSPSGIGIDLNRATSGSTERSNQNTGFGIQVWDWSSTDQGVDGPVGIFLKKINTGTGHNLIKTFTDKLALRMIADHGSGWATNNPMIELADESIGGPVYQLWAGGSEWFINAQGLNFDMVSGNDGLIISTSGNELDIRGGTGGVRILNNANTNTNLKITNQGSLVIGDAARATNATDGFVYIPTCAGTPTGTPTAQTGTVAMIFDTTNNKLYVYDAGWIDVT